MKFIDWSFEGKTRGVILISLLAFKFTWIREYLRGHTLYFSGIRANLHEYRRYRIYGDRLNLPWKLAPTYATCGVANLQRRGKALTSQELAASRIHRNFDREHLRKYDLHQAANYSWINSEIHQHDYGRSNLDEFFEAHCKRPALFVVR